MAEKSNTSFAKILSEGNELSKLCDLSEGKTSKTTKGEREITSKTTKSERDDTSETAERNRDDTSETIKSEPFDVEEINEGTVVITRSTIEFNYPGTHKSILSLTDNYDEDNVKTDDTHTDIREILRKLGTYMLRHGEELQKHIEQPSDENDEERRWRSNVEKHAWLQEKYSALRVKERTVDVHGRINELMNYRMTQDGTKVCLIIGNTNHGSKKNELKGCAIDCQYLHALFRQLGFQVTVQENLTAKDMEKFLTDIRQVLGDTIQCFVCAITGHGKPKGVLGSDRRLVKFQTILDMFDRENCPQLRDKPKLFLFDVCRGGNEDVAKVTAQEDERYNSIPPIKSDVLVAHATSHDYVSFTHSKYGSWFCRSFVKVVSENACTDSLLEMLVMVNRLVATFQSEDGCMQSARFECSLRKNIFFHVQMKENATNEEQMLPIQADADE